MSPRTQSLSAGRNELSDPHGTAVAADRLWCPPASGAASSLKDGRVTTETSRSEVTSCMLGIRGRSGDRPLDRDCYCVVVFAVAGFFGIQNAGSCARVSFGT